MISKEHRKHTKLSKAPYGNFGINEWAIVGTKCETIKNLAAHIIKALSPTYKCAYIDTQHTNSHDDMLAPMHIASGADTEYTDHINYHQFSISRPFTPFQYRQIFAACDVVLTNGNHHQAQNQIVIIDETKKESLRRRLSQLTNIELILLNSDVEIFDFIKEAIPTWHQIPVYQLNDTEKIICFFKDYMQKSLPVLNGLVLAGGKSERLGYDKGKINWHGNEQRYHMADKLAPLCNKVFISCRTEQQNEINPTYNTLPDTFIGLGPYGAILSALREYPHAAWLVIACDLPLVDAETLQYLIQNRNVSKIATTFQSPHDNLPEPLITIWEPKAYPLLLSFLSQGNSCPRKVLINSDAKMISPIHPDTLINVNTPEDSEKVKQIIEKGIHS